MTNPWTAKDTISMLAGCVGSASGLGSLFWLFVNGRKERLDLRLKAEIAWLEDPNAEGFFKAKRPVIRILITNHGRRETYVSGIGSTSEDRPFVLSGDAAIVGTSPLPRWLKDGEPIHVDLNLDLLGPDRSHDPALRALHVVDGRGKTWPLSQQAFLSVQAEARSLLARAAAESGVAEVAAENVAEAGGWPKDASGSAAEPERTA